jgi:hypothetical protein
VQCILVNDRLAIDCECGAKALSRQSLSACHYS